jgi:phosphoribosylformylglycinamidine synthase
VLRASHHGASLKRAHSGNPRQNCTRPDGYKRDEIGYQNSCFESRFGGKTRMKARVFVTLKNGVLDPQGKAIGHALNGLGFESVGEVRQGKVIDIEIAERDEAKARASLKAMCEKLLANTVIEKYEIELKA